MKSARGWRGLIGKVAWIGCGLLLVAGLMAVDPNWSGHIRRVDRMLLGAVKKVPKMADPAKRRRVQGLMRPLEPGLVLGYLYDPNATSQALNQLRRLVPVLTGIAADWYTVDAQGNVSGQTQPQVMRFAMARHLTTLAVVEQTTPSVLNSLLNNPTAESVSQYQMLTMVESDGFDGVNLDWEGIPAADRAHFSQYVGQLTNLFHQHGYYVTLSLPPEAHNQPGSSWTGAYNYRVLGREADLLMIMAYDQHWSGGTPGPIASTSWVRSVLSFAVSQVSPTKLILGIPGYGYDWASEGAGAVALTFTQAEQLKQQYAPKSSANHFQYVQGGVLHSVWFENTRSFLGKVQLVSGFELRGIVLWRIGIEDPKIWDFLE